MAVIVAIVDDDRVIEVDGIRLANPDQAWLPRLGQITAETLVIGGGPPSSIPQDWVVDLAGQIPGARMETIPVGHLIHHADPEAFTRTAVRFLSEPSRQPGQ